MHRCLILCLFALSTPVGASDMARFFYAVNDGGLLTCNGQPAEGSGPNKDQVPFDCVFSDGELVIALESWGWEGTATLTLNGTEPDPIITGFCTGSVKRDANAPDMYQYQLDPPCLSGDGPPPPATGEKLVEEWYTDLPWNQKLSTKDSNLINVPFVLPYEALPQEYRDKCVSQLKNPARCMLRYGIVNVMGMHRTDTVYKEDEALAREDCRNKRCVETVLKVQRFHTHTDNPLGYEADVIKNNRKELGGNRAIPSLGLAVTEATIFAPWRNWYTGHYCARLTDSIVTSVCYDDYFTTQLIAGVGPERNWLKDGPAIFWPRGTEPNFVTFCKSGEDACSMYLGKVDWLENASKWSLVGCWDPTDPQRNDLGTRCEDQIQDDTDYLTGNFFDSLAEFKDVGRYPWTEGNPRFPFDQEHNPFIGFYELQPEQKTDKDKFLFKSPHYVLPKECTKEDYRLARQGLASAITRLSECAVNFEIHTSGFHEIWKDLYGGGLPLAGDAVDEINRAIQGLDANQYGRTMFLYAGLPEQHLAVSFKALDSMSIHDKVYSGSIYIQYLPMVNPAGLSIHSGKNYTDDFWHAFLMSNHMNQTPDHFIRGIRGRTLWHNEYRSNKLYQSVEQGNNIGTAFEHILGHVDFPAGFQTQKESWEAPLAPFHGNTCDSCHIRNGSGIPLMPDGTLPTIHVDRGMLREYHVKTGDYTYTNKTYPDQEVPAMKLVFFDLDETFVKNPKQCDDDDHTVPKEIDLVPLVPASDKNYYSNKIMNFYGNSLPLNQNGKRLLYEMEYVDITDDDGFEVVDTTPRGAAMYRVKRVNVHNVQIKGADVCSEIHVKPARVPDGSWPSSCDEISGSQIEKAIEGGEIGFMHLLGRRLGNTPLIEMIPDAAILNAQREQKENGVPGCISLAPGTRSGTGGKYNYRNCTSGKYRKDGDANDCYIGRWGWIGDRASLEDQIANAAHVEMNISSSESYNQVHPHVDDEEELVRYDGTLCGPANARCQELAVNSDITEQEIRDMATYQRWIGIPNRSEYQVSRDKVQQGEALFNRLQCSSCHVIKKIAFRYDDNMLPDEERDHLRKLEIPTDADGYPFVSYLGTDLLMHDMGYLSQVAKAPDGVEIRQENGEVKNRYRNYVQYTRTPALKGLRFNRFVTDSNHNTKDSTEPLKNNFTPGCDFLLHDGRACDAIEAAYLHDGPAVKRLKMIEEMNRLSNGELEQLRAFLYSL